MQGSMKVNLSVQHTSLFTNSQPETLFSLDQPPIAYT